jgi:hypothetical protein
MYLQVHDMDELFGGGGAAAGGDTRMLKGFELLWLFSPGFVILYVQICIISLLSIYSYVYTTYLPEAQGSKGLETISLGTER